MAELSFQSKSYDVGQLYEAKRNMCRDFFLSPRAYDRFGVSGIPSVAIQTLGNKIHDSATTADDLRMALEKYTLAIIVAREPKYGGDESLFLAYANRAVVLQKLGYYRQAYDDCAMAWKYGYPVSKYSNIIMRQALLALNFNDPVLAEIHINALMEMSLNEQHMSELRKLQALLQQKREELRMAPANAGTKFDNTAKKYKIARDFYSFSGNKMIATQDIPGGEVIYTEEFSCIVPPNKGILCWKCAKIQFIAYPCHGCKGVALYCSVACRDAHQQDHKYTCAIGRYAFYNELKNSLIGMKLAMALQIVTQFLPKVVPLLKHLPSAAEICKHLNIVDRDSDGPIHDSLLKGTDYAEILEQSSYFQVYPIECKKQVEIIDKFVYFLEIYTDFFACCENSAAGIQDWRLIVATLLLRHFNQELLLYPLRTQFNSKMALLISSGMWKSVDHLERGRFHEVGFGFNYGIGLVPRRSKINNSCSPSAFVKCYGTTLAYYPFESIATSKEITVNYKNTFVFEGTNAHKYLLDDIGPKFCTSPYCSHKISDKYSRDFLTTCCTVRCLHCYNRLINTNYSEFVLPIKSVNRLVCRRCGTRQKVGDCTELTYFLCSRSSDFQEIDRLLADCRKLNKCFLHYNLDRLKFISELTYRCLSLYARGAVDLKDRNFEALNYLLKYFWNGPVNLLRLDIRTWWRVIALMLDLLALGKMKMTNVDFANLLNELAYFPDEFKQLAFNYYQDYIQCR